MAEKCEASVREYGLAATLAKVCLRPFGVWAARFKELHASWCDRHLGINTGGRVANGNLVLGELGMEMTFGEPSLRISFWRAHPRT